MSTQHSTRQRRRRRTTDAILATAQDILAAEGREGLSLAKIARRLDYTTPALYEYFTGKDELIAAVALEGFTRLCAQMERAAGSVQNDARERLVAISAEYWRFALTEPHLFGLMFTYTKASRVRRTDPIPEQAPYRVFLEAVQTGQATGVFPPAHAADGEALAFTLWSFVHGTITLRLTLLREVEMVSDDTVSRTLLRSFVNTMAWWGPKGD